MNRPRTGSSFPDILTSALLFLLIGPPIGGILLVCGYALLSNDERALLAIWPVPLLSYFVGGPAALLTSAFARRWLRRLHSRTTLVWFASFGAVSSVLTW